MITYQSRRNSRATDWSDCPDPGEPLQDLAAIYGWQKYRRVTLSDAGVCVEYA